MFNFTTRNYWIDLPVFFSYFSELDSVTESKLVSLLKILHVTSAAK